MSDLFDKTTLGLQTAINLRQMRQNITSSNIANAETPGYHAKKLDFEEALSRALDIDGMNSLSTSNPNHIPLGSVAANKVRPDIYENPEGVINNDGNTVNIENEMSQLAENSILYKAALHLINKKMAALKYAISEGK